MKWAISHLLALFLFLGTCVLIQQLVTNYWLVSPSSLRTEACGVQLSGRSDNPQFSAAAGAIKMFCLSLISPLISAHLSEGDSVQRSFTPRGHPLLRTFSDPMLAPALRREPGSHMCTVDRRTIEKVAQNAEIMWLINGIYGRAVNKHWNHIWEMAGEWNVIHRLFNLADSHSGSLRDMIQQTQFHTCNHFYCIHQLLYTILQYLPSHICIVFITDI